MLSLSTKENFLIQTFFESYFSYCQIASYCSILVELFQDNYLTEIAVKCHLIVSEYKDESMYAKVGDTLLWEENWIFVVKYFIDKLIKFMKGY